MSNKKNEVIKIALKWKQNPKNKNPNKTDRLINFIKNEDLSEGFLEHIKKELQFVLSKPNAQNQLFSLSKIKKGGA